MQVIVVQSIVRKLALLNQGMNANPASYPKVNLGLGFKNPTKEDSDLKSATPVEWYSTPLSFPPRLS